MPETVVKANGSWIGDIADEWKKLPTWGKFAAIGVLIVVAFLAWRARASGSTAQNAAASTASTNPLGSAGAATAGTQSPFPMIGNLPVLPGNVNPVFDSSGNPIAFQQGPPSTGNPGNVPLPPIPNPPAAYPGGTPGGPPVQPAPPPSNPGPLIANGQWNSVTHSTPWQFGQQVNVNGTTYTIGPGNGVIWGVPGANIGFKQWQSTPIGSAPGQKVALYNTAAPHVTSASPGH